jgi:hypothetical protein
MHVLLVYELVPEETKIFVIPAPTEEELAVLVRAAGQYGNTEDEGPEVNTVGEWIVDRWKDHEVDHNVPLTGPFDMVILCGFYL